MTLFKNISKGNKSNDDSIPARVHHNRDTDRIRLSFLKKKFKLNNLVDAPLFGAGCLLSRQEVFKTRAQTLGDGEIGHVRLITNNLPGSVHPPVRITGS